MIDYIDYVAIVVTVKFPSLRKLAVWAKECGLGINGNKNELHILHKGHNNTAFKSVFLDGVESQLFNRAKHLGNIFNRKLIRHILLYGDIVWNICERHRGWLLWASREHYVQRHRMHHIAYWTYIWKQVAANWPIRLQSISK